MTIKNIINAALCVCLIAGAAFAQKRKQPTSQIAVAKDLSLYEDAQVTSIQEAVNRAEPGWTIEILDTEVYEEQVTIDGRDESPWSGVTGGKNGITILYVPSAGTKPNASVARPTIKYRDEWNTSPKNITEGAVDGELPGTGSNFLTCGALRILHARNVTIDGIAVDGGGQFPFGANDVWGVSTNLFHGNAGIALVAAGRAIIRNTDIKNAYFGINVNDRNTGGVFGQALFDGTANTVPLSGFGRTGGHLIEYNRIHKNSIGVLFENAYDLGSTVRYNLIYENYHLPATQQQINGLPNSDSQKAGAFQFKDMTLTPLAIYNNTLHKNNAHILGNWQIGGQHLLFNNIFGLLYKDQNSDAGMMEIVGKFENRMHNSVFADMDPWPTFPPAANISLIDNFDYRFKSFDETSPDFLVPKWDDETVQTLIKNQGWPAAGIRNADGSMADLGAIASDDRRQADVVRFRPTGLVAINGTNADAQVFMTLESGTINSPRIRMLRFIAPVPGNRGSFGNDFDIVPESSIKTIDATNAMQYGDNRFSFTLPTAFVPTETSFGFVEIIVEGTNAAGQPVTSDVGFLPYRKLEYTLKLEVLHPTENTVVTDVIAGERYRLRVTAQQASGDPFTTGPLKDLTFDITSDDPTAQMYCHESAGAAVCAAGQPLTERNNVTSPATYPVYFTRAGETVIMSAGLFEQGANRLVFLGNTTINVLPGPPDQIKFTDPVSKSLLAGALPAVINRGADKDVTVEVQDRFGNAVRSAVPVTISSANSDLNSPAVTGITIGTVGPATATTDPATGVATFTARVVDGVPGQIFDMTAKITVGGEERSDVGSLRVGRTLDALAVFYADAETGFDADVVIDGNVGEWHKITVKAVVGDSVLTGRNQFVLVSGDDGLIFAAGADGTGQGIVFEMVNGVAEFYVSATGDISNACVFVSALRTSDTGDNDGSIGSGSRCEIRFVKPTSSIVNAVVYGNGRGVPDSLILNYVPGEGIGFYNPALFPLPDSVTLRWPLATSPGATVRAANIAVVDTFKLRVDFRGATTTLGGAFPPGYTDASGFGLATVYGGINGPTSEEEHFGVIDGVGPIIADTDDGREGLFNPAIMENPERDNGVLDTLVLRLSERIGDELDLEGDNSICYTQADPPDNNPATGCAATLNVLRAFAPSTGTTTYRLVLAADSYIPKPGNWIRLNPASAVRDRGGSAEAGVPVNAPHENNRWVRVVEMQVPPVARAGWYTSNPITGLLDSAYIVFNKDIDLDEWFDGGFFDFTTTSGAPTGPNARDFVSLMNDEEGNPRIVRVCLKQAYPSSQTSVITSGALNVHVGFNAEKMWDPMPVILSDRAKPVLMSTVSLKFGVVDDAGNRRPDTVTVVYSEAMPAGVTSILNPITITTSTRTITPTFTSASVVTATTVRYIMDGADREGIDPDNLSECSNCVSINHLAEVADIPGNVQDVKDNRPVDLSLDADLLWKLTISNNPLRSGDGNKSNFSLTSGMSLDMDATVRIFDNLGNLVKIWKLQPGIVSKLDWEWDGRNAKGRLVGSGTYLVIVDVKSSMSGADKKQSSTVRGRIGIIRKN